MTIQHTEPAERIQTLARLASCAAILQILESLIPHPLPGVRLGIANIITLIALVDKGFIFGLQVAILRTIVAAMVLGTFLTPPFFLSIASSITSCLVMGAMTALARYSPLPTFSVIGISVAGAATNAATQLVVAYLIIFRHHSILLLLPWLTLSAVISGWLTGLLARAVIRRLADLPQTPQNAGASSNPAPCEQVRPSLTRSPGSTVGLAFSLVVIICGILLSNPLHLAITLAILVSGLFVAAVPLVRIANSLAKTSGLVLISLILPVLSIHSGPLLASAGFITIHSHGATTGLTLALRILILVLAGVLISQLISIDQLLARLSKQRQSGAASFLQHVGTAILLTFQLTARNRDSFRQRLMDTIRLHGAKGIWTAIASTLADLYTDQSKVQPS